MLGVFSPGNDTSVANTILRVLLGCTFISIGFYGASLFYKIEFHPSYVILIAVAFTVVFLYNGTVAMYERLLGRYPFLYVATGVLGSWFLLQISKYIALLNKGYLIDLLELYGANSIIILCLHNFVIEIVRFVDYKFLSSYLNASGFIGGLIITCITMLILTPLFPFCEKYVQRFFGGKLYIKCWNKQSYIERNTK